VSDLGPSLIQFEEVWTLPKVNGHIKTDVDFFSMRLIKVEAFLEREYLIKEGKSVDRRKNVLEFGDDEVKEYVILSHRWVEQEVDYREMVKLVKMAVEERDEIRHRDGYQKILQSCEQAQKDGYNLADDPSDFWNCGEMELMGHNEFIEFLKDDIPEDPEGDIEDRLGSFPITNRGIQIWMLLQPCHGSRTLFRAWLPCRLFPGSPPVAIDLTLWESNYYRWPDTFFPKFPEVGPPRFRQVYLRYQDPLHRNTTFQVDDSTLTENGFTYCDAYPEEFRGNTLTLTSTDPLCVKAYFDSQANHRFSVGFGVWTMVWQGLDTCRFCRVYHYSATPMDGVFQPDIP